MFLTCQVDLPVAITMKSAQSQCLFPGKTLTLSALTSLRIFSTSWSSRRPALLEMAADAERLWLKLGNPSFHCWRSEEEEEDDDDEKQEDLDRRTAHMESSLSRAVAGFALQPFQRCSVSALLFYTTERADLGRVTTTWNGVVWDFPELSVIRTAPKQ